MKSFLLHLKSQFAHCRRSNTKTAGLISANHSSPLARFLSQSLFIFFVGLIVICHAALQAKAEKQCRGWSNTSTWRRDSLSGCGDNKSNGPINLKKKTRTDSQPSYSYECRQLRAQLEIRYGTMLTHSPLSAWSHPYGPPIKICLSIRTHVTTLSIY